MICKRNKNKAALADKPMSITLLKGNKKATVNGGSS